MNDRSPTPGKRVHLEVHDSIWNGRTIEIERFAGWPEIYAQEVSVVVGLMQDVFLRTCYWKEVPRAVQSSSRMKSSERKAPVFRRELPSRLRDCARESRADLQQSLTRLMGRLANEAGASALLPFVAPARCVRRYAGRLAECPLWSESCVSYGSEAATMKYPDGTDARDWRSCAVLKWRYRSDCVLGRYSMNTPPNTLRRIGTIWRRV